MRPILWGLIFVTVVMSLNPGVDVAPSYTPTLALAMGSLALAGSWLAALTRTIPAHAR